MKETPLSALGIDCQRILQLPVVDLRGNYFPDDKQTIAKSGATSARVALRTPECKGFEMNSDNQTSHEPHPKAGEPSSNRRNLLKAAASVAPFVATLPSGAALANASSVQCALNAQALAEVGLPLPAPSVPDNYYRVPAKSFIVIDGGLKNVYQFTPLDGSTDEIRVDQQGNNVSMSAPRIGDMTDVHLLYMYKPADSPLTKLVLNPNPAFATEPGDCYIDTSTPAVAAPAGCVYPIAKLELQSGPTGNIGMTASCMTSFVAGQ